MDKILFITNGEMTVVESQKDEIKGLYSISLQIYIFFLIKRLKKDNIEALWVVGDSCNVSDSYLATRGRSGHPV